MLKETIIDIMINVWPMLLIFVVIISSIRITYVITKKAPFVLYQELVALGFIIYILCLFYVVTFQDVTWSSSNFIPFREIFRYEIGSDMFIKNALGNILIFLPYGFFVSYFLKTNKVRNIFFLTVITSLTIEITQMMIGRVFDVDDILLNILGGLLGFYIYNVIHVIEKYLPKVLKKELFYNIIILLLLSLTAIAFFSWRF